MTILTVDTNTQILSCCITNNENLISEISIQNSRNQSINSIDIIDMMLKKSGITLNDVDGFVISKGPGSFTGLRIAFSIIKAFSYSLNKPIISLSSLDTLCFRENFNGIVCSIIDALRDEIYINSFSDKHSIVNNSHEGNIIHIDQIKNFISNKHENVEDILFIGDATIKFREKLNSYFNNPIINTRPITAYDYALLGIEKFKLNIFDDSKLTVPSYIRVSQAQENLSKNKK